MFTVYRIPYTLFQNKLDAHKNKKHLVIEYVIVFDESDILFQYY